MNTKSKQNLLYIIIALVIVGIFYVLYSVSQAINKNEHYVYVQNGRITNYESVKAIVARDEVVLDTSEFSGDMQVVAIDATKVAKGDNIVSFISQSSEDTKRYLDETDTKIQEIIESSNIEYPQDVKNTEKQIESEIYNLIDLKNSIYDISISKKALLSNLEKKITQIGDSYSKDSELNTLIKERNAYEKGINKNKVYLKAPQSGLVSYRVDGYEEKFPVNSFSGLSIDKIKSVKFVKNQQVPVTTDKVKLINNFYNYLILITKSEEAKNVKLNDVIKIGTTNDLNSYEKSTVEYIIDGKDERVLVLKVNNNIEKLSQYRVINANIIWWNYEGLKVQNDAIYDVTIKNPETEEVYANLKAVKVMGSTGYQKEVWIKVENSAEGFSIISNYTDEELIELGLPEERAKEHGVVSVFDRIVVGK